MIPLVGYPRKILKYPDETWELMKFMSSEMYETVLTKTPVAACAHAASADVFYNTVKDNGHEDAAEAVKTMMQSRPRTQSVMQLTGPATLVSFGILISTTSWMARAVPLIL